MTYEPVKWPAWMMRASGESQIFERPEDVTDGWLTVDAYRALSPLDLDGDGKPGGSLPDSETQTDERDTLRAQLTERGISFHHKMGVKRLTELLEG